MKSARRQPAKYNETTGAGKPREHARRQRDPRRLKDEHLREGSGLLRLSFIRSPFEKQYSAQHHGKCHSGHQECC
jgi:hypothetical protein